MKREKTEMKVECAWCGRPMGTKDGKGVTGTTSGICRKCADKEWAKLGGRPPARWNLIGRLIHRRRARRRYREDKDEDQEEKDALGRIIVSDPILHAQVILLGKRGVHYMTPEDLARLLQGAENEPEYKCIWN